MVEKPTPGRRSFLKAIGAGTLFGGLSGVASATPGRHPGPKKDEILVGVSASAADMEATVKRAVPGNAEIVHRNETLSYLAVKFPGQASTQAKDNFIDAVTNKSNVKYAEKNATYEALYRPSDPKFGDQYADQQVNAPTAWEDTLGDAGVTVAVVDQGVQYDHPDLQGNMASDPGKDFVDNDGDPYPDNLSKEIHGTHVAGIAAAGVDNSTGVSGIGNSTIISGRALSESGSGSTSDIADGIQWAADQGADVINLSLGGGGASQTMQNAVSYATSNGALVVAAAGNAGTRGVSYPAAFSECLAVSALDPDESLASYSQYGDSVELAAPGTNVLSTWPSPGNDYNKISGTSMATPVVAGVAGLTLAKWNLTNTELRSHLKNTAVDVGLSADKQGAGRVDAANAVTTDPGGGGGGNQSPNATADASPTAPSTGETVSFDGSGSSDSDGSISSYEWAFGDGASATGQTVSHSYSSTGEYTATLTVTDNDGASASDSVTITVGDGGGGDTTTGSVDGSLSSYWDGDNYSWSWEYSSPSKIVVELDGPSNADFDLYVNTGTTQNASPRNYDAASRSSNSQETVTIDAPDDSTAMQINVDSYSGSGNYTLTITESS
jgi:serine protease